jgi:hypothetical protein
MTETPVDQNKDKRFQVGGGAFVGVGPAFGKVGLIEDIGMDGLTFRYAYSSNELEELYLDIFLANGNCYLGKVPFKTVSDFETDYTPFGSLVMRRCRVQFRKLTLQQKADLRQFISDHAGCKI